MKMFDVYVRYTIAAESEAEALDKWDEGEAVFQEFDAIIEVM